MRSYTMQESLDKRQERLVHGPRVRAVESFLTDLMHEGRIDDNSSYALAMLLVDATLDGDEVSLHRANRHLQALYRVLVRAREGDAEQAIEARGRVLAFLDVAAWALERALSLAALAALEGDSAASEFMKAINERPGLTNHDISEIVGLSESEASRVGRRLADVGLVAKRRTGRTNNWEMTPKGLQSLQLLEGGASRFRRPNFQRT